MGEYNLLSSQKIDLTKTTFSSEGSARDCDSLRRVTDEGGRL